MPVGKKIKMYYDPRGNVIRTVNPDSSEQWVVYGKPNTLSSIAINNSWSFKNYAATPWESYTYDSDDLAPITNGTSYGHDFTPKSAIVDALGRTVKTIDRLSQISADDVVMKYQYDIRGNNTKIIDALNRIVFTHQYDLANKPLHTYHIDSGNKRNIADATGKPIQLNDEKGSVVLSSYDAIQRIKFAWAKDTAIDSFSVRQGIVYGDDTQGPIDPTDGNHLGKPYKNYDESGLNTMIAYDFKGNVIAHEKNAIKDSLLLAAINDGVNHSWDVTPYTVDWTVTPWNEESNLLEGNYRTDVIFDALNRAIETEYPADINSVRKKAIPTYNKAGAIEKVAFDGTDYVEHIAYNARGQKILIAYGNGLMTRHVYDKKTFRLKRTRTSAFTQSGWTYSDNGGAKEDKAFVYDLTGNILGTSDKVTDCGLPTTPNELNRNFVYDSLYRLLSATGRESNTQPPSDIWVDAAIPGTPNAQNCRAYTQQFQYDKVGNILKVTQTATSNSWTRRYNYNSNVNTLQNIDNNQTTPTVIAGFAYDVNGNQTQCNTERHYKWDYIDRMKSFYNQTGSGVEPTVYAVYLYDGSGNRTKKLVRKQGGTWNSVTYIDGAFEYHTNGTEEKNYTQVAGDVEIRTGSYSGDISDDVIYQMKDHLGSVGLRINDSGTTIDREEFYPFGDSSLRTFTYKRYRYCGKEKDEESGLYYYGARYYMSWAGRFISVDPLANKSSNQTPYHYCSNNPIVRVDKNGQEDGAVAESNPTDNSQSGTTIEVNASQGNNWAGQIGDSFDAPSQSKIEQADSLCVGKVEFATNADKEFVMQFVDSNSSKYNAEYSEKFNELSNSKTNTYLFGSFEHGDKTFSGKTMNVNETQVAVLFTKGDSPNAAPESPVGQGKYGALWEETYHAWDFQTGGMDLKNPTALDEAQAWKFGVNAPETKMTYPVIGDGKTYWDATVMAQFKTADETKVANWLSFGMEPREGFAGLGIPYEKPIQNNGVTEYVETGLYSKIPLGTIQLPNPKGQ